MRMAPELATMPSPLAPHDALPFQIYTAHERPDLLRDLDQADHPLNLLWPEFLDQDPVFQLFVPALFQIDYFSRYQFLAVEKDNVTGHEQIIGMARSIPFFWPELLTLDPTSRLSEHPKVLATLPEGGYDTILSWGIQQHLSREGLIDPLWSLSNDPPNALSALSITVRGDRRRTGLAEIFIRTMKQAAIDDSFRAMVVPLRPTQKPKYPSASMEDYVQWTISSTTDSTHCIPGPEVNSINVTLDSHQQRNSAFDPWLRKHLRLGGRIAKVAHRSMKVRGTDEQWRKWTGVDFEARAMEARACVDGDVMNIFIPGGLVPVKYHCRDKIGVYVEPNVWIYHELKD
ncbi:uncharacterized protein N7477_010002 [Penicillium maclennaniae]|uniref:uncharacterized protein n=1 Tax=Penicillium maclennaniae TaxID=1343394 RepID=UPI00254265E4|nr:uncharacterized protein N7477_010002 [Penicillium maclennaniae]KAJ5662386.1 hypothetical protein N7477_010002 [Penicillium maclennaniae]